jgi:diguanylate cyclase (GGDEF)-like protein
MPSPRILEEGRSEILAAILDQQSLCSTLQCIADVFLTLYPLQAMAIFRVTEDQLRLEAEAGLPYRVPRAAGPVLARAPDDLLGSCPAFQEILESGVALRLPWPLISGSGEMRGAVTVFDRYPEREVSGRERNDSETLGLTLQSLCSLAHLAIEHCRLYEEVEHRAHYDQLTGLPNRSLLEDRLRQAMITARRQDTLVGVCCIDLDRFKAVNDRLGYEPGDTALKLVGERLSGGIREIDTLAHYGGDEFMLILRDLAHVSDAHKICLRLLQDVGRPFMIDGHTITITASAGISIFPEHANTADLLLRNADLAMRAAKRTGPGEAELYSPVMGRQSRRAAEIAEALMAAIAGDQFRMVYQPIYTVKKEIIGFEGLLRWKHPAWGQISPLEFVPIAEETGLIVPIGDWVLSKVCRQAREWDVGGALPIRFFINVSGVQLARPDFTEKIAATLKESGLAPNRIELEITESWIISNLKGAAEKLQTLRDLGIGTAIDDFGIGYANFSYLQELPLDTLKIDRSFIHRLNGSSANLSTVRAITGLAQQLGLQVVAEGIETEQQLSQLREIGCDLLQGFFLSRPLRPQIAWSLLAKQQFVECLTG